MVSILKESDTLWNLIFGPSPLEDDVSRWMQQRFVLSHKFVLEQTHGGPCGILATIQAFMLIEIIFRKKVVVSNVEELISGQVMESVIVSSLVNALEIVIERAANGEVSKPIQIVSFNTETKKFETFEMKNPHDLMNLSLLDFLATVVTHRGIDVVKSDMDDSSTPLISRFGQCSQEILNLVLFGVATSNVFDGDQNIGMPLRGVPTDANVPIGLLSELEALRYVTVGSKLKNPIYPFWLIGSTNHYTLLFSITEIKREEEDPCITAFKAHELDDGIATGDSVEKISTDLKLNEEDKTKLKSMVKEDVLLFSDYREWIKSVRGDSSPKNVKNHSLQLFLVDGQHPVSVYAVTLSETQISIPESVVDYGENLRGLVRTKWPEYKHVCASKLV